MTTPLTRILLPAAITLCLAALAIATYADGAMRSKQLSTGVCETTGGGRFVKIPGFRGERIDRRLVRDVRFLARRYKILVTDGHSLDPVHSANGEHPIGLALDIVPNSAAGGTWKDIDRLARWAEPRQNQPRAPFRWVGYNGDAGHGSGHHLHLSWSHSETAYNKPARTVYSIHCPTKKKKSPANPGTDPGATPDSGGATDGGGKRGGGKGKGGKRDEGRAGGGISPGGGSATNGGISARKLHRLELRAAASSSSVETGGVGAR